MVGREASVSTSGVVAAVAGSREAGHLGRMNLDPREEGVDHHQTLYCEMDVLKERGTLYLVLFSMKIQ
jgi:hypothetical protein